MDPAAIGALLLYLFAAHVLMDFALQSETMAACKCPGTAHPAAQAVPWYFWLSAHAALHGAAAAAVLCCFGSPWWLVNFVFIGETLLHTAIDWGKCRRFYGIHTDQLLHYGCKLLWVAGGAYFHGGCS